MMAAEEGLPVVSSEEISGNSEFSGSALLIIIGEPFSDDHKELIVERLTKALQSWDATTSGLDINAELEAIAQAAPTGTEGSNGERVIEHYSDALHVDVLVNPEIQTVSSRLRVFLKKNATYRHIVYSGHYFHGSGSWVLQDDWFSFSKFVALFKEPDVDAAIKKQMDKVLAISVFSEGDWVPNNLAKHSFGKILEVRINPGTKLDSINGVLQFSAYLSYFVNPLSVKQLLKASDVVGNIRFSRPTLYIFPGFQGDSALFGISGFNLLVNGGYGRKACFWDFTRHLDRIDALLLSHLSEDNLFGASAVLERKAQDNVHPEIGFVYFNALDEKQKNSPNGDIHPEDGGSHKPTSLSVDLIQEGNKMVENIKCINQEPHPCLGRNLGTTLQPINLYHKVGHGSLDMYVLNPLQDNKEMKEFLAQWGKHASTFSSKNGIPLPHLLSIAALLVWKPSAPSEKITRILFPGSVPQAKLFDGMDKLKTVEIFKHAECSEESLKAPPVSKAKKMPTGRIPPVQKNPASPSVSRTARRDRDQAEPKETPSSEKRRPIAKPDAAKSKVTKKADKKTTTKSTAESDTKSTSSVETPPPPSVEDVASPAESTVPADAAVLCLFKSESDAKDTEKAEVPPLVTVEPVVKTNGSLETTEGNISVLEADKMSVESKSPVSEKYVEDEIAKESEIQSPEVLKTPVTSPDSDASPAQDIGQKAEEPVADSSPSPIQDAETVQVEDVHLEEKQQQQAEAAPSGQLFESPDALPDPELLKDQTLCTEEDDIASPFMQSAKDDEKDIDTTELDSNPMDEVKVDHSLDKMLFSDRLLSEQSEDCQSSNLIDISPSEEDFPHNKPATPVQSESFLTPADDQVLLEEKESNSQGIPSPEADQPSEILGTVEGDHSALSQGFESLDPLSDVANVQADYNFDKVSDDGSKDDFAKGNGFAIGSHTFEKEGESILQSETPGNLVKPVNGITGNNEPFDGARPEGLPLPQEPDVNIEEPCELNDVPKMSEGSDAQFGYQHLAEEDISCVDSLSNAEINNKQSESMDDTFAIKTELQTAPEESSYIVDGNNSEFRRDSESELPDNFTSEDVSVTDMMKDSIENNFAEEDSLNVSKDSLLDGDPVAETIPAEKFEEISDAPKDITVPECDQSSPTNPFTGMSQSESAESQVTDENGEHIPFAEETPPSESIIEPDSLMEDLPHHQHQDLPHDLLGQLQQVNASLVDFSQTDGQSGSEYNQQVQADDTVEEFDPLKEWGQPMGLPAPTPDSEKAAAKSPRTSGKAAASKNKDAPTKSGSRLAPTPADRKAAAEKNNGDKKTTTARPRFGAKKPASATPRSGASKGSEAKADPTGKPAMGKTDDTKKPTTTASKRMSMGVGKRATPPIKDDLTKDEKKPASKMTQSKRSATTSTTKVTAPAPVKLLPVVPFYVDLTYIPHHGDSDYVNINYFRRVRARYYVYSALRPDVNVLQSLLDAKQTWDDPNLEVTVIPTYDTEALRLWITQNREKLVSLKVDIAPSASRCTIQLQDHETSCAAFRLEF